MTYKQFKEYMKNNERGFYEWFKTNYLTPDQKHFKETRQITPTKIQGMLVKDGIQWDGSDPDDVIVFMIGQENMNNDECSNVLTNKDEAVRFLESLSDKHDENHKEAMKTLAKWKAVASASQKDLFKNQITYMFENEGAEARFREAVRSGRNTLSLTTNDAYQESARQPSSPLRDADVNSTPLLGRNEPDGPTNEEGYQQLND